VVFVGSPVIEADVMLLDPSKASATKEYSY